LFNPIITADESKEIWPPQVSLPEIVFITIEASMPILFCCYVKKSILFLYSPRSFSVYNNLLCLLRHSHLV